MSLYNLFHSALFRLKDLRDGSGIYSMLKVLAREQYLPKEHLNQIRASRLCSLLKHARDHSPYYQDLFSSLAIRIDDSFDLSQLCTILPLRREDLQNDLDRIVCDNATDIQRDASGGSTGQPVNFFHDRSYSRYSSANRHLFLSWMNIKSGDKTAIIWGADRDLSESSRYDRLMNRLNRVQQLNSFSMTEETVSDFLDNLNSFKPRYIYGYSSALYHVAQFIKSGKNKLMFRPTAIRSSAETLFDFQREEIENAFKTRVFDFYGSREVNNIAAECEKHDGLHIFASGRIIEIVDDRGHPLPEGEVGQIAVTDLTNYSFPFIRYINGDLGSLKKELCSCGRTYPLLAGLHGRSTDMITIGQQQIHGEFFTHLFYNQPNVRQFQLVQETESELKLFIVAKNEAGLDLEFFRRAIIDKVGQKVKLEIVLTDRIKPGPGGKHRFTLSKVKREKP